MIATIFQAVGVAVISLGVGLAYPPAGVAFAGVGLLLFGLALERGK